MVLINIGVLAAIAAGVWWLTGMDKTIGGESKRSHYFTRTLRSVAVVFLAAVFLWMAEGGGGSGAVGLLLILTVSIAISLRSSLAELFSGGFLRLVDPTLHDDRPLDPGKSGYHMDTIAHLIHKGRHDEAVKLCEELKQSGEMDRMTLETTLAFLGVKPEHAPAPKPLTETARLRSEGNYTGAEQRLQSLLAKDPSDTSAAMMLMRVYAQDLRQPGRAREVLRQLERQPDVPASHIEFARRSIEEWSKSAAGSPHGPA